MEEKTIRTAWKDRLAVRLSIGLGQTQFRKYNRARQLLTVLGTIVKSFEKKDLF